MNDKRRGARSLERLPGVLVACVCGFLGAGDHGVFARVSRRIASDVARSLEQASPHEVEIPDQYALLPRAATRWHLRVLRLRDHGAVHPHVLLLRDTAAWRSLHTLSFSLQMSAAARWS